GTPQVSLCCQAEDGIRDLIVTGVQTCALPIDPALKAGLAEARARVGFPDTPDWGKVGRPVAVPAWVDWLASWPAWAAGLALSAEIGRASCRERVERWVVAGGLMDRVAGQRSRK